MMPIPPFVPQRLGARASSPRRGALGERVLPGKGGASRPGEPMGAAPPRTGATGETGETGGKHDNRASRMSRVSRMSR